MNLHTPTIRPALVQVPRMTLLAVDGTGEPYGPHFRAALKSLYAASGAVRRALMSIGAAPYTLPPPEGLSPDWARWRWCLMMAQPPRVDAGVVEASGVTNPFRLVTRPAGTCVQALHIGPYREVNSTLDRIRTHVERLGYEAVGGRQEIYLSNPQRTAAGKLKTLIRYPTATRRTPAGEA